MGVTCQILIRKPREGIHKAGTSVDGIVKYSVEEPEEYKDILLSLVGKGVVYWKESRQTARGREPVTYTNTEVYTSQYIRVYDKGSAPTFILPVGTYEYPFKFNLPEDIPASFEDDVCSIKYKLALKFEKPNYFSAHEVFGTEINVGSYIRPLEGRTLFALQKTLFKPFNKKTHSIKLKVEISNTTLNPGQNVKLTYVVVNDSDITIPSVRTELICYTTYTANCGKTKQSETTIKKCTVETPSVPENAIANMSNTMHTLVDLNSIQNCRIIAKQYKVKVTVRLPLPHFNEPFEIPIVIGESRSTSYGEGSDHKFEEEPPSYFEAMNKHKGND